MTRTRRLTYSALLLSCGLLLPQAFHFIGGPGAGATFLPMHIPVLLGGLLLGAGYGAFLGLALPLFSSLLTSMPAAAKLPFMAAELVCYGTLTGLCRRLPVYAALAVSLVGGRLVCFFALAAAFYGFGLSVPAPLTVVAALSSGLIGVAIQLAVIPPLYVHIRRFTRCDKN